jgi:DNA-binding transcriptional MerR regulator
LLIVAAMGPYTIGQLAHAVGVPASTLRYYERAKLLRPDGRTGGNYRVYGASALERLRFIRAAQANGFTLDDILALLSFRDGATARCKEVQRLIKDRLRGCEKNRQGTPCAKRNLLGASGRIFVGEIISQPLSPMS